MATDIKIDPATKDFVDDGLGGWIEADDSSTAVFCQLEQESGWWGDPSSGSRNKAILRGDVPTLLQLLDSSKRAMGQLVQAGVISDVSITAIDDGPITEADQRARGFGDMQIVWRDRVSNTPADLAYSPLGGNPKVV